ncbi:MAG: hypothetical protein Q7U80_01490 [Thiobacillus sp.]|nr:hypothetical protein [Thiobacillus sp.]
MLKTRNVLIVLGMLMAPAAPAAVQVSIGIGLPHASIGINLPAYPQLVVVPGYPVYYAPHMQTNYFFYDGMYWVFQGDNWYASSWYNGPWWFVEPYAVPVYVLRIPVRYYRQPPVYFRGWRPDAPPRWSNHWGHDWERQRSGWDKWDRRAVPAPAPLPAYQKQYSGQRYPRQIEQQHQIQQQRYRYQPRDPVVREQYQERYQKRVAQPAPTRENRQGTSEERDFRQQDMQRSTPRQPDAPGAPHSQSPQRGDANVRMPAPASPQERSPQARDSRQPPQPGRDLHMQQTPGPQGREEKQQGRDTTREQKRNQEKERDRDHDRNN